MQEVRRKEIDFPGGELAVANALELIATELFDRRLYDQSESLIREVLEIRRREIPASVEAFTAQGRLGEILAAQGIYETSSELMIAAYDALEDRVSAENESLNRIVRSLIQVFEAQEMPKQTHQWQSRLASLESSDDVSATLRQQAKTFEEEGKFSSAIDLYRQIDALPAQRLDQAAVGSLNARAFNWAQAAEAFQAEASVSKPNGWNLHRQMATAFQSGDLQRYREARSDALAFADQVKNLWELWHVLRGVLLLPIEAEEMAAVEKMVDRTAAKFSADNRNHRTIALAKYRLKRSQPAWYTRQPEAAIKPSHEEQLVGCLIKIRDQTEFTSVKEVDDIRRKIAARNDREIKSGGLGKNWWEHIERAALLREADRVQSEFASSIDVPSTDGSVREDVEAVPREQKSPPRIEQQTALLFDGQKGTFGLPELLLDPYDGITVEAWVRVHGMSATGKWGDLILIARTGRKRETWFQLKVDENAKWQLQAYAPSYARSRRLTETIATGAELVHVAATFTTERMNLYVNGKWEGESDISDLRLTDHWKLGIAGYHTGNAVFKGLLDELRISRAVRYEDDFQPQREFEADDQTVALYHFDANARKTAFDDSGNRHHAQLNESEFVVVRTSSAETKDKKQNQSIPDTVSLTLPGEHEAAMTLRVIDLNSLPQVKPLFHYQDAPQREDAIQTAMRCNGKDSHFTSPPVTLDLGSGITLESWIKPEQLSESQSGDPFIAATTGESDSVSLAIKLQRSLDFISVLSSREQAKNSFAHGNEASKLQEPLEDSPWVHVAVTIQDGKMSMFVGGKPTGSGDVSAHPLSENWIFHIGGNAKRQELIGLIDEVRISDTVRYTESFEPAREFTPDEQTTVLYHFDAHKNDIIYDHSGNKHHVKKKKVDWADIQQEAAVLNP
jgi:tetratricopeptide (TPR) repeat protein